MADCIVPIPKPARAATRMEVRCNVVVAENNLDIPMDGDLTKKFSLRIARIGEPQDDTGDRVGDRVPLDNVNVPMGEAMARTFTAAGITLPGAAILALFNEVIDTYKGKDL
jgi:hypothetical protein